MRILLTFLMSFFAVQIASADIYVYSTVGSNEVIFITEDQSSVFIAPEDSATIEETILKKDIEFYNLTEDYSNYLMKHKKFILNTQKATDKADKKAQHEADKVKKDDDFESAKAKLIILGLTADEVDSLK